MTQNRPGNPSRQRHWQNRGQPGDTIFVTSTALDFADVFREECAKDAVVELLFADHRRYGAILDAFVVMRNHVHFLTDLPESHDARWFVQRVKSNVAKLIKPTLDEEQRLQLSLQSGLNGRSFWKWGFRSVVVDTDSMFWQKVAYMHGNPLRAHITREPEEYRWSSARLFQAGLWQEKRGLMAVDAGAFWRPHTLPQPQHRGC